MDSHNVGAYLRGLREQCGLSPGQVAVRLGVGESTIYRIEGGRAEPRSRLLMRYAALVGADGNRLIEMFNQEVAA